MTVGMNFKVAKQMVEPRSINERLTLFPISFISIVCNLAGIATASAEVHKFNVLKLSCEGQYDLFS
jgi:hypothetical protein